MGVRFKESEHGGFWVNHTDGYTAGQITHDKIKNKWLFSAWDEDFTAEDLESIAAKLRELNGETKGQTE